ncbi:MAG: tRNA (guanosine(46)-N7)-methyltransferase TrmB [Bacteroidales bacterium]|jgi:tRNA (guanine-N7-)-methyltransferase|nr:tRNA (guanosine(46)-N7)-methyltransferase TrmB [Bacteroidales bacterium]MBR6846601.1 tRNA (guanosine(46)-N7)-methyltransferase TrmB [Bacteroidales bacterium]
MSKKNKLQKFEENKSFDNLFQYSYERIMAEGFPLQGRWRTDFFHNDNPIVLELGCGKGEYTVGLARAHRDINYIGIDIKGARMWRGLTQAREEGLTNVAFIRARIDQIEHFFGPDEVDEIWVTFPDPHPGEGERNARHRLTSPEFLQRYRKIVKPEGILNLKTDSPIMYEFTLHEVIEKQGLPLLYATDDLYANDDVIEVKTIRTFYEQMWLDQGLTIKYLRFKIRVNR